MGRGAKKGSNNGGGNKKGDRIAKKGCCTWCGAKSKDELCDKCKVEYYIRLNRAGKEKEMEAQK